MDAREARKALVAVQQPTLRTFQAAAAVLNGHPGPDDPLHWLGRAASLMVFAAEGGDAQAHSMPIVLANVLRAFQAADMDASASLKAHLLGVGEWEVASRG